MYSKNKERLFIYGSIYSLVIEGKLDLLPAENSETKQGASVTAKMIEKGVKVSHSLLYIIEDREDALLKLITKSDKPIAVCIYGGGHAFGGNHSFGNYYDLKGRQNIIDNIAVWNAKHQQQKISLIEITPQSYKED